MARAFSASWLDGDPAARVLLPDDFRDPAARVRRARLAAERGVAPALIEALAAQDRALPPSEARRRGLEALARPGTVAVVTGQQVGLFLGPLFTTYKAASAIAAARAIEREAGVRAVPIFWLQTEDHDFAEIDHCHVLRPGGAEPLRLNASDASASAAGDEAARIPVAYRPLGDDVLEALEALDRALAGLPGTAEHLAILRAHYRPGRTFAAAFAGALAALFAGEELLLLDPRDPAIAHLAAPVYRRALDDAAGIEAALVERGAALAAGGWFEQVHVRPGSPLFFFHERDARGPRRRLERAGSNWRAGASLVDDRELRALIDRAPLRFSTSALLRPLLQDTLLPTAAYVGGPGEVSYFAQLAAVAPRFELPVPLIVPRARFRLLDDNCRALLGKLGLSPRDAERPRDELLRALAPKSDEWPTADALRAELLADVTRRLDALEPRLPSLDANLVSPLRRTRETVAQAVTRFCDRYDRSRVERDRLLCDRIDRLQRTLFPNNEPQERHYSLPSFAVRSPNLLKNLLAQTKPFSTEIVDADV